jgi:hypothetical protein
VLNGVYPTTPTDPAKPSWGSYTTGFDTAQGRFESAPLPECSGFIRIEVAGYLGWRGLSLVLQNLQSGTQTPIETDVPAQEQWTAVVVRCPSAPFSIVAIDANTHSWLAFRSPVVIGLGSGLAQRLVDQSWGLLLFVTALALVGLRLSKPE